MEPNQNPTPAYAAMLKEASQRRQKALKLQQENKSLKEIGAILGVSRERARQLIAAAIRENKGGR